MPQGSGRTFQAWSFRDSWKPRILSVFLMSGLWFEGLYCEEPTVTLKDGCPWKMRGATHKNAHCSLKDHHPNTMEYKLLHSHLELATQPT